jgi:iron(III) transport system ATP-binding protein
MPQPDLQVRSLTKTFETPEGPTTAVQSVNLDVHGDEFFSLLGPSGCGKTTTLRMIAGLETATSGEIIFNGRNLAGLAPAQRNLGMVFQSYALFPHLTVFENAAYGLRIRQKKGVNLRQRVEELLGILGLAGLANRYPADLSGGQQQRVSIARALAYEPDMFLLDEPLANLDAKLRVQMREEIRRIQKELGVLALYVTHDQEEAMSVSDRIGVFQLGHLMQVGAPEEIYRNPTSLFVADFIGKINFFPGVMQNGDANGGRCRLSGGTEVTASRVQELTEKERLEFRLSGDSVLAVRPEHLVLQPAGTEGIPGRIRRVLFLGSVVRYFVQCDDALREVMVETANPTGDYREEQDVTLGFQPEHAICFRK